MFERVEAIVDAVAEALGVDTGAISEAKFERACEACRKAMEPKPTNTGFMTVVEKGLAVSLLHDEKTSKEIVTTMEQFKAWCDKWNVDDFSCSSSVDFPEEDTDDPAIIALCRQIRGG